MDRPGQMRVESATDGDDAAVVVTTGARFRFAAGGHVEADQRLPTPRACFVATIRATHDTTIDASPAPWRVVSSDATHAVLRRGELTATVRDDSTVLLQADSGSDAATIHVRPAFSATSIAWNWGPRVVLDDRGGYGAYPAHAMPDKGRMSAHLRSTPEFDDALAPERPLRLAVFPPRPPDPRLLGWNIAHEGTPGAPLPPDAAIAAAARSCRVLALHAYIWRAAPWRLRFPPGRYFLRGNAWRSARHEPADAHDLSRAMSTARRHGMKVVLYLSPRHSTAPDLFTEIARVLDTHSPDGLYLDGLTSLRGAAGLARMEKIVRRVRGMLGPDRLLYLHPGDEPYGTPLLACPFIDAHADFVLRGSEGAGGRPLAAFLRYDVSGWNVSGAVGVWCHYGTPTTALRRVLPFERAPTADDIDLATRSHVRLWRRSRWGAAALDAFDDRYGAAFESMLRDERASLADPDGPPTA